MIRGTMITLLSLALMGVCLGYAVCYAYINAQSIYLKTNSGNIEAYEFMWHNNSCIAIPNMGVWCE